MRKFLIGLISFGIVLLGFWGYIKWMDTAPISVPQATDRDDMEMPQIKTEMQSISGVQVISADIAQLFRYDPVTKEVVAEYGFKKLLNPGEGSSRWRVEKPYLIFYQSNYQCRIDSDRGTFQIETVGSQSIPKDAQLDENVVIHITPKPGSGVAETTIHMDDLTFSSERSEFSTNGPVKIESSQLQLEGYGLVLIFNTGQGKVEYLQVKDLDFLRVKDFASSGSPLREKSVAAPNEEATSPPQVAGPSAQPATASPETGTSTTEPDAVSPSDLYQCAIRDNVEIQYGDELIVSGAYQVDILNIRFSNTNADDQQDSDGSSTGTAKTSTNVTKPQKDSASGSSDVQPKPPQDVIVKCDGGMIIQPMQPTGVGADESLALEMSGDPLKIDRMRTGSSNNSETLAHCGALYYKPNEDVLRLFTNKRQPQILLNTQESNSRIETNGNVSWDRKAQRANIGGPGKVFIGNAKNPAAQPSEISFNGMMDLLFAQMPDELSSATIRTINFTGGMDAILHQNGTLKTLADSALLEFGHENQLSEAHLDGDVHFESFEAGKSSSKAAAQSAIFYFDNNQIETADLKGAVHFVSASGRMDSTNARIEFSPDSSGAMHPKMIRTDGKSILQTQSTMAKQPPAKFEARKIDYDLQTGAGLAHGPIRFIFYQPADPNVIGESDWIPVTITADENAQFLADADRTIKQVIFNKNVVASRVAETPLYTQQDEFHGDKLIVDVDKDSAGSTAINRITFVDGKVFGQSRKLRGEEVLFNVRLTCSKMIYNQSSGVVQVTGPGDIQLDNSKAAASGAGNVGINFQRPSYALIEGFDTIAWNLNDREITANGDEKTMQFAYIPLVDGQVEKYIFVNSRKLQARYRTDAFGKPVIERIFTDKGITYIEMDPDRQKILRSLVGQTFVYDAISDVGWLTITGSEAVPCMVNNARVPVIRYNVNTGQLKTSLSTVPGVLSPLQ